MTTKTKTYSVSTGHSYMSKGVEWTVGEVMSWIEDNFQDEDGNTKYAPGDVLILGGLRLMALHKDNERFGAGAKPERVYTPRVAGIDGVAKNASEVKAAAKDAMMHALRLATERKAARQPAPAVKAPKSSKPAKSGKVLRREDLEAISRNEARIAELQAMLSKPASPEPPPAAKHVAKGFTVRKAAAKPDTGLRPVDTHIQGADKVGPSSDDLLTLAAAAERRGDAALAAKYYRAALALEN